MKPNLIGGQTFEPIPEELGIIRNASNQAEDIFSVVPKDSAEQGNSPIFNILEQSIMPTILGSYTYENLRIVLRDIRIKACDPECVSKGLEATYSESNLIIGCLAWMADPRNRFVTASAEQKTHAKALVDQYRGTAASIEK